MRISSTKRSRAIFRRLYITSCITISRLQSKKSIPSEHIASPVVFVVVAVVVVVIISLSLTLSRLCFSRARARTPCLYRTFTLLGFIHKIQSTYLPSAYTHNHPHTHTHLHTRIHPNTLNTCAHVHAPTTVPVDLRVVSSRRISSGTNPTRNKKHKSTRKVYVRDNNSNKKQRLIRIVYVGDTSGRLQHCGLLLFGRVRFRHPFAVK